MKIIKSTTKNGTKRVVVECHPDEQLIAIQPNSHYQLGYPIYDIVHADQIRGAELVTWDVVSQKWMT